MSDARDKLFQFLKTLSLFVFLLLVFPKSGLSQSSATTYYVDCNGNDSNNGTAENTPWKTIYKASSANLQPGDKLLFKRGCTWSKTSTGIHLEAKWDGTAQNPITIGAYGTGNLPIIQFDAGSDQNKYYAVNVQITGSYQIIENLETKVINHWKDPNCENQAVGFFVGFNFRPTAHYNILRNSKTSEHTVGIHFFADRNTAHSDLPSFNKVINNTVVHNWVMSVLTPFDPNDPRYDDIGAWGILLKGNDNEIAYNHIENNNGVCSYENEGSTSSAGYQGNSIELFIAKRNKIHHNTAINDKDFAEIGGDIVDKAYNAEDNVFAYNVYVSNAEYARFITNHGMTSIYGPTYGTKLYNNTVYLTGAHSQGVVCVLGCTHEVLVMKNNIIWAIEKAYFTGANQPFLETNNLYWNGTGTFPNNYFQNQTVHSTSKKQNPLFVTAGSNFKLQSGSPAINAGTIESVNNGWVKDMADITVPQSTLPDIGAYEAGSVTPTAAATAAPTTTQPTNIPSPVPTIDPLISDINADGIVNNIDYDIVAANFGSTDCATIADIDNNCLVDIFDINQVVTDYGKTAQISTTPIPTSPSQTANFEPFADTFVEEGSSLTHGSDLLLQIDLSPNQTSYMKFDLRPYAGKTVISAKLKLYVPAGSSSLNSQTVRSVANTTWNEATMTYTSRPTLGGSLGTITPSTGGEWKEVDITPYVASGIGQIISLGIDSTGTDGIDFNSREAITNPVRMTLIYQN
jgi:hypothetical protein